MYWKYDTGLCPPEATVSMLTDVTLSWQTGPNDDIWQIPAH